MEDPVDLALDLMRRLNPENVNENIANILSLNPEISNDLLSAVDRPLQVRRCIDTGKDYLICDYNKDRDSYRSPWSNNYDPVLSDGTLPSPTLRKLEVLANEAFDTYRDMYFGGGVSSVYMWDLDDGFAAVVLIKKVNDESMSAKGSWDSIHVLEVHEKGRHAHYRLTSSVILSLSTSQPSSGDFNLAGNLTRQADADMPVENYNVHVANMGKMVEDMEIKMRNLLQEIYFGKTKDISSELRSLQSLQEQKKQNALQAEVVNKLYDRN